MLNYNKLILNRNSIKWFINMKNYTILSLGNTEEIWGNFTSMVG